MTPDEKQLLSGLFDRIRQAGGGARDAEAERFILDATRQNPNAAYVLSQTVLIQEQALAAANQKIQDLQAQVAQNEGSGSFLGGIGKSIFGNSQPAQPPRQTGYAPSYPQQNYAQPAPSPWGAAPAAGGGFLSGALHTAAGVAGGMLLAEGIRGLFSGGHSTGMMSNIAGTTDLSSMLGNHTPTENVTNNFFGGSDPAQDDSDTQDDSDSSYDDSSSFGNDTTDA